MVMETPRHRQRSRLAWQREQVVKQMSRSGPPAVQVIAESPDKQSESWWLHACLCACMRVCVCVLLCANPPSKRMNLRFVWLKVCLVNLPSERLGFVEPLRVVCLCVVCGGVCVCMYVVCVSVHACMHVSVCVCVHMHVCDVQCMHAYVCVHECVHMHE